MQESILLGSEPAIAGSYNALFIADSLLVLHSLYIAFVILGLLLVVIGWPLKWRWVRNPWFRYLHLGAIGIVVLQAWFGLPCPLTIWENAFRAEAGELQYRGSFIQHWLTELIYYRAAPWVFTFAYTAFGLLTLATIIFVRPTRNA